MNELTPQDELEQEPTTPVIEGSLSSEEPEIKAEETPEVEEKKKQSRSAYRIEQLNTQVREAERREAEKDAKIKAFEEATRIKEEPDPDDFGSHEEYQEKRKAYTSQQVDDLVAQRMQEAQDKARQAEASQQINKQTETYVMSRVEVIEADPKYRDYEANVDSVVKAYGAPQIHNAILKGGGTDMVKYFGKNPDELTKIAAMHPDDRLFELGQIASKVKAKTPKKISSAPDPIRSEKGGATVNSNRPTVRGSARKKNETKAERYKRING